MQENRNLEQNIDGYLCKLENLSSQIAESISLGNFGEVTKLDLERKNIISVISQDSKNLNDNNTSRLKLIWVNNNQLVKDAEEHMENRKKKFLKAKKIFRAYSKL